jgi:glycosyltransferase involved in cell wall biosynthesis
MRVLIDGLPLLGEAGIATYVRGLLLHLAVADTEHEYHLFFRGFRSETRRRVARLLADPHFAQFRTRITRIPDRVLEWCWARSRRFPPITEAWLGQPDLFFSTVYMTPVLQGIPIVMMAYDLIPLRFPQFYGRAKTHRALVCRNLERATAIIAISECTKRDFVELLSADPSRIHVVYPAADARFTPSFDPASRDAVLQRHGIQPPYLLYVGSLGPHKNVDTLVRVFRQLKETRRLPHSLVLCGKAEWGPDVVGGARDMVASGDCVILNFVPNADLPALYQGTDAFVFLSLYEGFGLPPLEAMACGVPVVSSNAGSLPEVVGNAGILVDPTDEPAIEAALVRVLSDPGLRQDLRARGLRQAARFSWAEAARQTLKVFEFARSSV